MRQEKSYGVIPIYKNNGVESLFLIIKHNSGHWGFPKGHTEQGESKIETAKRELEEETGISQCDIIEEVLFAERYITAGTEIPINKSVEYFVGIVPSTDVKILEKEISAYKWVSYKDALNIITYNKSKNILKKVKRYLDMHNLC